VRYYGAVTSRAYLAILTAADIANRCPLLLSFADEALELVLLVTL